MGLTDTGGPARVALRREPRAAAEHYYLYYLHCYSDYSISRYTALGLLLLS